MFYHRIRLSEFYKVFVIIFGKHREGIHNRDIDKF